MIFSKSQQEHLEHNIKKVFTKLRAAGLKVNAKKWMFECDNLHTIGRSKVQPDDINIEAVRALKTKKLL